MKNLERHQLANGVPLYFYRLKGAPRLALDVMLPAGNLQDPVYGTADLVDRLLLKDTKRHSQEELAEAIDSLSLDLGCDTRRDSSLLGATFLEEDMDASLDLILEVLTEATLEAAPRETEKMAGEIAMDLDAPKSLSSDIFSRTIFGTRSGPSPYGVTGTVMLGEFSRLQDAELLQRFYQARYRLDRIHGLVAVGDIDPEKLLSAINRTIGQKPSTEAIEPPKAAMPEAPEWLAQLTHTASRTVGVARDDSSQTHIFRGWLAPKARDEDYAATIVMNTILGGAGLSSRLFTELRDKQGLAYNVRSSFDVFKYRGVYGLYIGCEASKKEKSLIGFDTECGRLMNDRVPDWEMDEARRNVLGRRAVFLETAGQLASYIAANLSLGRSPEEIEALPSKIAAVTTDDVQRVAQQLMGQPSITSIVGPSAVLGGVERLESLLGLPEQAMAG